MKKLLLFLLVLTLIILVVLIFLKSQEDKADKVGDYNLTTDSFVVGEGQVFSVDVGFRTGVNGEARAISAMSFRLTYPTGGDAPQIVVVDKDGDESNVVYPSDAILGTADWSFPVRSVRAEGDFIVIDFAAVNTSLDGYVQDGFFPLAKIYFKADEVPSPLNFKLSFDEEESKMMTKEDPPVNILSIPGNLNFSISP